MNELESLKKRIIYRASYRGTKEMDILMGNFVNKDINEMNKSSLRELENFLNLEDEDILNFYQHGIVKNNIDKNGISKIFKEFKI